MKILIIYCHPSKKSYTYEVLQQLLSNLDQENITYDVSDLYAMSFQTDMTESEYEREGFANTHIDIPNDVSVEQDKIQHADSVIFVYPVWWSDCPAKLKGWFDRVYSVGFAYGKTTAKESDKMKLLNYGLILCTAGHPNDFLTKIGIAESMRNVMIDDRLGNRFKNKEMIILGGTTNIESVRINHSQIINSIPDKIKKYSHVLHS